MASAKIPSIDGLPMRHRHDVPNPMTEDLISDQALTSGDDDRLDHAAIVRVAADMITATAPPVNIALFGSWGSGKSSFLASLRGELKKRDSSIQVARYDAWKYGGRALKLNFIESVAEQLGETAADFGTGLSADQESSRLRMWSYLWRNKAALFLAALFAVAVTAVWFFAVAGATWVTDLDAGFDDAVSLAITGVGSVLSVALIAVLVGPKVLESAVVKVTTPAPQTDDQFASRFKKLVVKVTRGRKTLVVFVDELDRCAPDDVVATLIDLKTFLEVPGCVFVVAADREVLEAALRKVPQSTPVREADPYYSTPGAFLDKIFQHQLSLPPLRPQTLTKFARDLVAQHDGVWADLRAAQPHDRLFLEVVYLLVPVHVRSPRRVKVLLNHYATTVRTAQARGINWLPRASEIAVYTVLQVEFPRLAADLSGAPMLLTYLRGAGVPARATRLQELVEKYLAKDGAGTMPAEPAGPMLDTGVDEDSKKQANLVLNAQLRSYLAKAAAQGVPDPRPDLFYMQSAGSQHGIADPEVGYVIDVAADLSPDEVLERLRDQPSSVLTASAHLLAQQAEDELGPGRSAVIESLCRVLEQLGAEELGEVAALVAPIVRAATVDDDLRDGAIPGALTLGVVTGRSDLVDALVERYSADEFAQKGLLARLAHVVASGDERARKIVRRLLVQAYENDPSPLHEALTTLPLNAAVNLWSESRPTIEKLLERLAADTAAAAARSTASRAAASDPVESATDRYAALLDAVEARTDDAQILISGVLMLGQLADDGALRTLTREREDDAIERITDPELRTSHALVGMANAPVGDCGWWSKYVAALTVDPSLARAATVRLLTALPTASGKTAQSMSTALDTVIPLLDTDGTTATVDALDAAVASLSWLADPDVIARRDTAYQTVGPISKLGQGERAQQIIAADIVKAFDTSFDDATVTHVLGLARNVDAATGSRIDGLLETRTTPTGQEAAVVRVRLTCRKIAGLPSLPASVIVAALPHAQPKDGIVSAWTESSPPLADFLRVESHQSPTVPTLRRYARQLRVENRTTLWQSMNRRDDDHLAAVGSHGVGEAVFAGLHQLVTSATSQADRSRVVDLALTARPADTPARRAVADMVLTLLGTGVRGDGPLATKLALLLDEVPYGMVTRLRDGFDTHLALDNHRITKRQQERLRERRLLSKRSKDPLSLVLRSVRRGASDD